MFEVAYKHVDWVVGICFARTKLSLQFIPIPLTNVSIWLGKRELILVRFDTLLIFVIICVFNLLSTWFGLSDLFYYIYRCLFLNLILQPISYAFTYRYFATRNIHFEFLLKPVFQKTKTFSRQRLVRLQQVVIRF